MEEYDIENNDLGKKVQRKTYTGILVEMIVGIGTPSAESTSQMVSLLELLHNQIESDWDATIRKERRKRHITQYSK